MAEPAISVIVPVYNTAKYLDECMDSLTNQTFTDIQIICIDDGSTDGSTERLDAIAASDSRVIVIHQTNAGVSQARNNGLEVATGKYVMFVDSDDYLERFACQTLFKLAQDNQAQIVVFGGTTFPQVDGIFSESLDTRNVVYQGNSVLALFNETGAFPLMCNKLYLRSLITNNGIRFDDSLTIGEDHAFQFCIFPFAQNVVFCQDPFYNYRIGHGGSAMQIIGQDLVNRSYAHLNLVRTVLDFWQKHDFINGFEKELLQWTAHFFFPDAQEISMSSRSVFSDDYQKLLKQYGLMPYNSCLDGRYLEKQNFLLSAADYVAQQSKSKTPQATIVLLPPTSKTALQSAFKCAAGQIMQDIQIICLIDSRDKETNKIMSELVDNDVRAQMLDYCNGSLPVIDSGDLINAIKADYVLFASCDDWYADNTLLQLVDLANQNHADMVTFCDILQILNNKDMDRQLLSLAGPFTSNPTVTAWISANQLGQDLLDFASLSCSNKLFSCHLLSELIVENQSFFPQLPESIAFALFKAKRIVPTNAQYLEMGLYNTSNSVFPVELVDQRVASFNAIQQWIDSDIGNSLHQQALDNTILTMFLAPIKHIKSADTALKLLPVCATALVNLGDPRSKDLDWYHHQEDYNLAIRTIATLDFPADSIERVAAICDVLSAICGTNRELACDLTHKAISLRGAAHRSEELEQHIQELQRSTMFRVGKAVTFIPRKIKEMI